MRNYVWRLLAVGVTAAWLCFSLTGCGTNKMPVIESLPEEAPPPLGKPVQVSLADLLDKPRAELAEMADDWTSRLQIQERARREGTLPFALLPQLRFPLVAPVWREARFSPQAGFSLPPYLAEGSTDNELALHLARYGDVEAARRLADPADAGTLQRIEACRCERNYPVEWTRLAGLMLHAAQVRLATGDVEGRTELMSLHRQLAAVLDAKAAGGPLGAVLLPRGHRTLTLAAAAWREAQKNDVAEQAEADLAAWGEWPAPALAIPVGASRTEVAHLLRSRGQGRIVPALSTTRALDVFALPVPAEGAQAVIACFDSAQRLTEVLVTYQPRTVEHYPGPAQLGQVLEDFGKKAVDAPSVGGVTCRSYPLGDLTCDVALVPRGSIIGGYVRCRGRLSARSASEGQRSLPRDFGAVHLNRSYQQNRLWLAPEQSGDLIRTERAAALSQVNNLLAPLRPAQATLWREAGHEVLARLTLRYAVDDPAPPLYQIALPLWAIWGPGRWEGVNDTEGGHLALIWEDKTTRCALRLPHIGQAVILEVEDRQGPEALAQRDVAAAAFDRAERQARLAAGKPLTRIPRHLGLSWATPHPRVQLGMSRDQVQEVLPRGQAVRKLDLPNGLNVVFTGNPSKSAVHAVRQLFVRFDDSGRVVEVRARYADGPAATSVGQWTRDLISGWQQSSGAPSEVPAPWAKGWADQPARKPLPSLHVWRDDRTVLTCQRDFGGTEVTLLDCPPAQELGVRLPPLEFLPRGADGCVLGLTRDQLLQKWGITEPVTVADGALVLPAPQGSLYDTLLVWFDKDRVVRIVARHAASGPRSPQQLGQLVKEAWGRDLNSLGWPRRQEITDDQLQGLGWNDDRTRLRIFWQESDHGPPRLFTEWKEW